MNIKKKLLQLYNIFPYLKLVENKLTLFFFIIFGGSSIKLKIKNKVQLQIKQDEINTLQNLLAVLTYSVRNDFESNQKLTISFDHKNNFSFSLDLSSPETIKLLGLFYHGIKNGAYFQSESVLGNLKYDKSILILNSSPRIVQTINEIRFYLESLDPLVFVETFILQIHKINFVNTLEDKIVLDVGANIGDTSLFFASHGAKVYAFEPLKTNYDALLKNIS